MTHLLFIDEGMEANPNILGVLGIMLPIIISLGAFLLIFGLNYLQRRERMAMIEKGIDPNASQTANKTPQWGVLRASLLFLGVGFGLLLSYFITAYTNGDEAGIYFPMIFICGGLGLLISYLIEVRNQKKLN